MNRKLRPENSLYQIKEKQINFLLEDVEKKLEEYKKAIELKTDNSLKQTTYFREQKKGTIHCYKKIDY